VLLGCEVALDVEVVRYETPPMDCEPQQIRSRAVTLHPPSRNVAHVWLWHKCDLSRCAHYRRCCCMTGQSGAHILGFNAVHSQNAKEGAYLCA
jgi:hypothetical protein